ncbi:MAG: FAD-dependent oxidoreductase [Verrucomicrobia bacterium]|nr:FAD-dependent oxidoreductase [Verrucomicrobiota bacterium]
MIRLAALLFAFSSIAHGATEADVIVYGATPGGFCAAIAAAREGASVILLEPTAHVGGVNTGGLCFSDSNQTVRSTVMGLFDEWHSRIEADYVKRGVTLPYKVSVKDNTHWTYEPHVAAKITQAMLNEAGVKVMTKQVIKSVTKEKTRISKLLTSSDEFEAKIFIDGTYEGDLMAAAGVSWTIGREGRKEFGESLAGKQYPKKKIEISGLGDDGKALPLITTTDAGPEEEGDKNVMVYSFRLCVTKTPANRVPFPQPANYDPARFEVVRRYFAQEKRPTSPWDLYPLPGNKFDANNGIGKQFSMGLVGACNGWSEADEAGRAKIWEAHKQYTLEMHHFLCTDPAVPAAIRAEFSQIGLCRDEFPDYGHWSPQLYVREGRRMIGEYVISQKDIITQPEKEDAIVVSSFPIDSHDCQRVGTSEFVINEGTIMPMRMAERKHGYPYHIPYRAITPKSSECTNLLVPIALSCTHVGISSIRVEPTWMILGQSAGIAAALSAKQNVAVQKLPYPALRERLLAQKQVLDLPVLSDVQPEVKGGIDPKTLQGIILDDTDAKLEGEWKHSASFKPYINSGYVHDDKRGDGHSTATFRFKVPKSGKYELRMAYSAHETRAKQVPISIESSGEKFTLSFDQTQPLPAGAAFRSAGVIQLSADGETRIVISNKGTEGFVIIDALQLNMIME